MKPRQIALVSIALLVLALCALAWNWSRSAQKSGAADAATQRYLTQPVTIGEVRRTVSASGSLKPVAMIDIGTQVSGTIKNLLVDFNTEVQAGQLLAELDTTLLDADLAQAQAQQRSAATNLGLTSLRLNRASGLFDQGYIARSEVDDAQAAVQSAQATVDQFDAVVARASNNKRNAQIRSPVSGTVVSREVAIGQTVAASLQTPVLFRIAKDLRAMQIEANVSEADVGFMREGLAVSFTVDAFPGRVFQGKVHQVRNNAVVQQNVVTYTMIVHTQNDDLSLRPGMTAYLNVTVAERAEVTRIPNAALRYQGSASAPQASSASGQHLVWRVSDGGVTVESVAIQLGLADAKHTELVKGSVKSGELLVIGERVKAAQFGPKLF